MDDWLVDRHARNLYAWYPLTGLIHIYLRTEIPDCLSDIWTSNQVIVSEKRELVVWTCPPGKPIEPENCTAIVLPTEVVWEMRGRDSTAPYYSLYRNTDNRFRLESEINGAARKAVRALMA